MSKANFYDIEGQIEEVLVPLSNWDGKIVKEELGKASKMRLSTDSVIELIKTKNSVFLICTKADGKKYDWSFSMEGFKAMQMLYAQIESLEAYHETIKSEPRPKVWTLTVDTATGDFIEPDVQDDSTGSPAASNRTEEPGTPQSSSTD